MAIKFEKITPGMTLLDIHSQPVGNTTLRALGCWRVRIISVDIDARTAIVSWNSNRPEEWPECRLRKLHMKPSKTYLDQQARRATGR